MSFYVSLDFTPTIKELKDLQIYNSKTWSLLSVGINNTKTDNIKPTLILKNLNDFDWYIWNLILFISSINEKECINILNSFANNCNYNNSGTYINEFLNNNKDILSENFNCTEYVIECYTYVLTKTKVINFKKLITKEEILNRYQIENYQVTLVNSSTIYSYINEDFSIFFPITAS